MKLPAFSFKNFSKQYKKVMVFCGTEPAHLSNFTWLIMSEL